MRRQPAGRRSGPDHQRYGPPRAQRHRQLQHLDRCAAHRHGFASTKASNPPARQSLIPNPAVDGMLVIQPSARTGRCSRELCRTIFRCSLVECATGGLRINWIPKQSDRPPARAHLPYHADRHRSVRQVCVREHTTYQITAHRLAGSTVLGLHCRVTLAPLSRSPDTATAVRPATVDSEWHSITVTTAAITSSPHRRTPRRPHPASPIRDPPRNMTRTPP